MIIMCVRWCINYEGCITVHIVYANKIAHSLLSVQAFVVLLLLLLCFNRFWQNAENEWFMCNHKGVKCMHCCVTIETKKKINSNEEWGEKIKDFSVMSFYDRHRINAINLLTFANKFAWNHFVFKSHYFFFFHSALTFSILPLGASQTGSCVSFT